MNTRSVPVDRIKTISVNVVAYAGQSEAAITEQAATMMGREIAAKLFEFNKVVRNDVPGDRYVYFSAALDVIVPEAPDLNKLARAP